VAWFIPLVRPRRRLPSRTASAVRLRARLSCSGTASRRPAVPLHDVPAPSDRCASVIGPVCLCCGRHACRRSPAAGVRVGCDRGEAAARADGPGRWWCSRCRSPGRSRSGRSPVPADGRRRLPRPVRHWGPGGSDGCRRGRAGGRRGWVATVSEVRPPGSKAARSGRGAGAGMRRRRGTVPRACCSPGRCRRWSGRCRIRGSLVELRVRRSDAAVFGGYRKWLRGHESRTKGRRSRGFSSCCRLRNSSRFPSSSLQVLSNILDVTRLAFTTGSVFVAYSGSSPTCSTVDEPSACRTDGRFHVFFA
jgi:hypothetical protein